MLRTEQHLCSDRHLSDDKHAVGVLSKFNKDQTHTKSLI